jgi:hypothetical protein
MSLAEYDEGEIALPNEAGLSIFSGNLRQFILLTRRAYSETALANLEETENLNVRIHKEQEEVEPYFGITLKFQPRDDLEAFIDNSGDDFFNSILRISATSTKRGVSGDRPVFVREFRRATDPILGDVMETQILISTSVFFNDYRVTVGFPGDEDEVENATESIFKQLRDNWGEQVKLDLEACFSPYSEEVNSFS